MQIVSAVITIIALALIAGLLAAWAKGFQRRHGLLAAINTLPANVGKSTNSRRYKATAALATARLLVKAGANDGLIAAVTATSDKPLGAITDEAAAADDPVDVELLGVTNSTMVMVAGAAISTLGLSVYMTAAGKVVIKPTAAGTYWKVGTNLTLAEADADPVEVAPCAPRKLIVIAALGNANSAISGLTSSATTTQAEFNALRDACETLADDVRAIAGALNGEADVALATT